MRRVRNSRFLTDREMQLARTVFKNTLPYDKIVISDGLGGGDRPFTVPTSLKLTALFNVNSGKYVIHAGDGYYGMSRFDSDKALLIHELTHVWQGEHSSHSWNYVLDSLWHQALSEDAYSYDKLRWKNWSEYNAEQQASIVEDWFVGGMHRQEDEDIRFYYIKRHIWGEPMDHDWIKASQTIRPLPAPTLNIPMAYPTLDSFLLPVLERRFHQSDIKGYTDRVKRLEDLFGNIGADNARELQRRLRVRHRGDQVSEFFYDHLSSATRNKLLGLLAKH